MYTDAQILEQARTALFGILSGEAASYTINGRQYTALDIEKVQRIVSTYEARVARAESGIFAVGVNRSAR